MTVVARGSFDQVFFVDAIRATPVERAVAMSRGAAQLWLRSAGSSALDALTLGRIQALARGGSFASGSSRASRDAMQRDVEDALQSGQLLAVRVARARHVSVPLPEEEQEVLGPPTEPQSWIEIELVDDRGKPVPDEAYEIETADGVRRSGTLDWKGRAREEGIDPGRCKVRFPRLHEWRVAG
jgi:hypothetical protein